MMVKLRNLCDEEWALVDANNRFSQAVQDIGECVCEKDCEHQLELKKAQSKMLRVSSMLGSKLHRESNGIYDDE